MKNFSFILLLVITTIGVSSCQPAKQGSYEAPSRGNGGQIEVDPTVKIDSSVEKAISHVTTKRNYHL